MSADRGAVAAGRDVVADLIVTGDRNTFFVGGYQRLSEAYIDPREVFDRVDVKRFVGRDWLIAELDGFLASQPCGYFVVEAAAGLGKTALLAHLVATRSWVHHFSELAPGEAGIALARMSLAAQLIRAYDLRDAKEGAEPVLSEAASSRADFLRGLLSDAAERLRDGEKLVLVVDALDEAGTRPGENVLGLPQVLPAGVFVVASKRPVPVDLYTESPRRVVRIDPDSDGNRQDVRAYLTAAAPEALAEAIFAKSHGVWIYVRYALQHAAGDTLDPDTLPEGLWAWYHRFWRSWADAHAADWHGVQLPLLATLAAAREELALAELCRLAGVEPAVPELPAAWRPYLIVSRDRPRRHRLYHASLSDFLHGRSAMEDSAEQDFADDLADATRAAHSRIADLTLGDGDDLVHLAAHLRHAERYDELFALVEEPEWRTRLLLGDPTAGAYLGSVTEAWDHAAELDRQAAAEGRAPPHLRREIACALAAEDVRSFGSYLPAKILGRLVAGRIWTPEQALAVAATSPYPNPRALGLAAVLPHLREAQRVAELREFFAWADGDRERALRALAEHVPVSVMPEALRFAAEIELDGDRADGLAELAPHLPAALLADAVEVATAIEDRTDRVEALAALLPRLDGETRDQALGVALAALEEAAAIDHYVARLVSALAPAAGDRLLARAEALEKPDARAEALTALVPHLEGEPRAAALAAAVSAVAGIEDGDDCAEALAALAPHLPDELVPEAMDIAIAIEDPDDRARALAALGPRLSYALLSEALVTAEHEYVRAQTIDALAPYLDDVRLAEALRVAAELERENDRLVALAALAPHVPGEALAAADALADETERARALAVVATLAAEPAAIERAIDAARALDDPEERCEMLSALAGHEPAVAGEALEAARAIEDEEDRADAVIALAPVLGGDETAEAFRFALAAVAEIEGAYEREEALTKLEPLLPDELLPDAVRAALAPVDAREREGLFTLLDEPREPETATRTADGAPAAELERRLDEAAATLGSRALARALGEVAGELPDSQLPWAFAIASRIPRARMRRRALVDLAAVAAAAPPAVAHECFDIALRGAVEHLDVPRFVRALLPITDRLGQLDSGGAPWRRS